MDKIEKEINRIFIPAKIKFSKHGDGENDPLYWGICDACFDAYNIYDTRGKEGLEKWLNDEFNSWITVHDFQYQFGYQAVATILKLVLFGSVPDDIDCIREGGRRFEPMRWDEHGKKRK